MADAGDERVGSGVAVGDEGKFLEREMVFEHD